MRYDDPTLRKLLAGEYAIGTLQGGARRRFEQLLARDPALRDEVERWQHQLAPLATVMEPQTPPPAVWKGIERQIGGPTARRAPSLMDRLRSFGLGWAAAAMLAGVMVGQLLPATAPDPHTEAGAAQLPPSYVGVLATADGRAGLLVSSLRHGRVADLKFLVDPATPAGQVHFLWALPADGSAPIPLGPIPPGAKVSLTLPDTSEALLSKVSRLAVSVEADGAMPAGPSGEYAFIGFCGKFWL
ncbi:MAG: anti-sigma factor [Rhodocyclaceae bacterium]|nr:anti-sigma factor [Rhodocyclaceae bacterium]